MVVHAPMLPVILYKDLAFFLIVICWPFYLLCDVIMTVEYALTFSKLSVNLERPQRWAFLLKCKISLGPPLGGSVRFGEPRQGSVRHRWAKPICIRDATWDPPLHPWLTDRSIFRHATSTGESTGPRRRRPTALAAMTVTYFYCCSVFFLKKKTSILKLKRRPSLNETNSIYLKHNSTLRTICHSLSSTYLNRRWT